MKASVINRAAFSVLLFFLILAALSAAVSALLFEFRAGKEYIKYAAYFAAAIAAYISCRFASSKCGDPLFAPITAVTEVLIMLIITIIFNTESYSPPFIVPAICLTIGIIVYLSGSQSGRRSHKRKTLKRKNKQNI